MRGTLDYIVHLFKDCALWSNGAKWLADACRKLARYDTLCTVLSVPGSYHNGGLVVPSQVKYHTMKF
jgi:hypothetical protein